MLKTRMIAGRLEAGCDEAGRGPLAGPVAAAAVLLPEGFSHPDIDDSKKLGERQRDQLRAVIEAEALAWAVAMVGPKEIDQMNILRASSHAMCLAAGALLGGESEVVASGGKALGEVRPEALLIDGNRFYNETPLPYQCIVKGDATYLAIAAASILAKTYRDQEMPRLHQQYPQYGWDRNKGYPTADHYRAIERHGICLEHRKSFTLYRQRTLFN